ncbi:helix-turn-helix transcriptional regulator [Saccharopolyspora erythraea]|uniref:helix-turn-helix domain-containing protein n=1 Tax=Saccharopolyspora erythraea TaxID=1836 RepID=UPI001BA744A3|nr:helix-turn-helix transcriptional regulator [Saccharopolyspora erythraea]QUH05418.1 helix-turn-helix transcriptional regulator [Saccharopolyspora erythraea]
MALATRFPVVATTKRAVGELLREWRERRRLSQLALSIEADISTRHLSFVETGRSRPTSDMVLRLCEHLDVPLRERNGLLLAAGHAPVYPAGDLGTPEMSEVRAALRQVLTGYEPYPALVVDRGWNLIDANAAVGMFLAGADEDLLVPPINVLRLSLHPRGIAPRIANLGEWRAHVLGRLRRQADATADPGLELLHQKLREYPCDQPEPDIERPVAGEVAVPLRYRHEGRELAFISMTAVFGTPLDVTLAELAIESFLPADPATAEALRDA